MNQVEPSPLDELLVHASYPDDGDGAASAAALRDFTSKRHPDGLRPREDADFTPGRLWDRSTILSPEMSSVPEADLLSNPIAFSRLANRYSKKSPLSIDDPDLRLIVRLCELEELELLAAGLDADSKRDCLLMAGYWEAASQLPGWDEFAEQPYAGWDSALKSIAISNGEACGLCERMEGHGVIGNSGPMVGLYRDVDQITQLRGDPAPIVLIEGGQGSGKGAIIEALHAMSGRPGRPLRRLNLATYSESLVESDLFGHKKGAYTGASEDREGFFQECAKKGGTVVLDDINHSPRSLQPKLLQVLEERVITRAGQNEHTDVSGAMVIVTTNESLREKENFLPDLLERISRDLIEVPDLSLRETDVPLLARHFLLGADPPVVYQYRYQIARKFLQWTRDDMLTVRSMKNEIGRLCRRSRSVGQTHDKRERIKAVIQAIRSSGKPPTKAAVARHCHISPSSLSTDNNPWGRAWLCVEENDEIPDTNL